jgi:hypothetical protein
MQSFLHVLLIEGGTQSHLARVWQEAGDMGYHEGCRLDAYRFSPSPATGGTGLGPGAALSGRG